MPRTAQFTDEFLRLDVTMLYQLGVVGPKWDRARRHVGPSPVYRIATDGSEIRSLLEAGVLTVTGSLLESAQLIRLGSYAKGLFGGSRLTFQCPNCERQCFSLFVPTPSSLVRPDGTSNQCLVLCKHCHRLRTPAWRFDGQDSGRSMMQRRTLREKLAPNPAERQPGCSATRHQRRFGRWLRAEGRVLAGTSIHSS